MNKRHFRALLVVPVLLAWFGCSSAAEALVIITNPGVVLGGADVGDVFLGEKQFAGTVKLVPVDNASAQEAFLARVLRIDAAKYTTSWTKKAFRDGVNPPQVKATDAEVIDFVKRTPGAVGYVKSAPAEGVKAILLK